MDKSLVFSIRPAPASPTLLARASLPFCLAISLLALVGASAARGQVAEEQDGKFVLLFDKTNGNPRVEIKTNLSNHPNLVSIGKYLQLRADRELKKIDELCKLTDDQETSLHGAFVLDDALLARIVRELISEMEREPSDFTGFDFVLPYLQRIGGVGPKIRQGYFKEGSLSHKVLQTKLDNRQKELLHNFYLQKFVDRIADGMYLNVSQKAWLKIRIIESDDRKKPVFDPNIHLEDFKKMNISELIQRTGPEYVGPFNSSMLRTEFID